MRMNKLFLLAAAAVAAMSCVKENLPTANENPTPEVELVPMTFTASYETDAQSTQNPQNAASTRVAYEDGATVWKVGDKIMVISAETGNAEPFTAVSVSEDGKNATFEGLNEAAETYYAVYPASAYKGEPTDVTTGKKLYVNVAQTQQGINGTFDPDAIFCTSSNKGNEFNFKQACAFLKFQFDNPADIKKVHLKVNGSVNVAGIGYLGVNETDNPEHRGASTDSKLTTYDMITLNAPEGGFVEGEDYFIAMRANSCPSGVTFYIEYDDCVKSRTTENRVFPAQDPDDATKPYGSKGKIRNLGQLDKNLGDVTPYDAYQLGADLVVAGKSYSPADLGTATLVSESTTISANGVYFIAEGVDIQISKGPYSKLFLVGNSPDSKTNVTLTEQFRYSTNGVIGLKNLAFAQYSSDMFVHNNTAEATRFAFDNCDIIMPTSNGVMYNGASRTLAEFAMHNCNIAVTLDSQQFLRTSANYSNIDLHNNIFYAKEGDKLDFYFINYSSNPVDNLKLTQNTFANVYNITSEAGQNPYINVASVANYILENNLFYLERYNSYNNPTSWILSCTPSASVVNNNMLYKDVNNQRLQVYKGGAYTAYTATKASVVTGEVDLSVPTIVPATTAGATR